MLVIILVYVGEFKTNLCAYMIFLSLLCFSSFLYLPTIKKNAVGTKPRWYQIHRRLALSFEFHTVNSCLFTGVVLLQFPSCYITHGQLIWGSWQVPLYQTFLSHDWIKMFHPWPQAFNHIYSYIRNHCSNSHTGYVTVQTSWQYCTFKPSKWFWNCFREGDIMFIFGLVSTSKSHPSIHFLLTFADPNLNLKNNPVKT